MENAVLTAAWGTAVPTGQLWETLLQPKPPLFFKMLLFPAPSVITLPEKAEVRTQLQNPLQTVVQKVLENNYFELCFQGVGRRAMEELWNRPQTGVQSSLPNNETFFNSYIN